MFRLIEIRLINIRWKLKQCCRGFFCILLGAPFCHGMREAHLCGGPTVAYGGSLSGRYKPLVIKPNTMWTVEISVATEDEMKGVFIADAYVITEGAPRCLHKYPVQLTVV